MTMKNVGGSLAFNGQDNSDLAPKGSSKYSGNQHGGKSGGVGAPQMRDPARLSKMTGSPSTASGKEQYRGQGGVEAKCPSNPDAIFIGKQMTKGNS